MEVEDCLQLKWGSNPKTLIRKIKKIKKGCRRWGSNSQPSVLAKMVITVANLLNVLLYECEFNVLLYENEFNVPLYECEFNVLLYECEFNVLLYECEFNVLLYECEFNGFFVVVVFLPA